jgi:glycine dehydrogenase
MVNVFEQQSREFQRRHVGPDAREAREMLHVAGASDIDELIARTVPGAIRLQKPLRLPAPLSEAQLLAELKDKSLLNKVFRSYIGQGYYDTLTPSVILRNVMENPGWYTQYTPYQAEISQGRLESLLNFQTMVCDLTGLPLANASLLDEATAAAEAMSLFFHQVNRTEEITAPKFFVDAKVFAQTRDVVLTRAIPLGIDVVTGDYATAAVDGSYFGALLQYPDAEGTINDYRAFIAKVHAAGGFVAMATDLLALTLLASPGELDADVALGSSQRFGVPLGYGGPHAAFFATKETFKRGIPGRIIGISIDAQGNRALRMALQTREQHIKREKATSNICTAQALLANMAAMYAVYHGPKGLEAIAQRVALLTARLAEGLPVARHAFFDTLHVSDIDTVKVRAAAETAGINFHYPPTGGITISLDETTTPGDVQDILLVFGVKKSTAAPGAMHIPDFAIRQTPYLTHPVFNTHRSESQMMRYIKQLENKDLSLNTSMISLGSCTMKLNAATEMIPLSWSHWSKMHPFAPLDQAEGYMQIVRELSEYLCAITGLSACSLQPNSGAHG